MSFHENAAQKQRNRQLYLGVLLFAGALTAIMVLLLGFAWARPESVQPVAPYVITLAAGGVLFVLFLTWMAMRKEWQLKKRLENGMSRKLRVRSCPDYWTRSTSGDKVICTAAYAPSSTERVQLGSGKTPAVISLSDYNNKKVSEACALKKQQVKTPWSDMDALCGSYGKS